MQDNNEIKLGANVIDDQVTYKAVAEAFGLDCVSVERIHLNSKKIAKKWKRTGEYFHHRSFISF